MVAFGLAPAVLVYQWGVIASANTATSGAVRLGDRVLLCAVCGPALARFNTHSASGDKRYFQGLASPSAAATVAALSGFSPSGANRTARTDTGFRRSPATPRR
jgi:CDP-diacylglycerol--serine O-phosphatidyltransferase